MKRGDMVHQIYQVLRVCPEFPVGDEGHYRASDLAMVILAVVEEAGMTPPIYETSIENSTICCFETGKDYAEGWER